VKKNSYQAAEQPSHSAAIASLYNFDNTSYLRKNFDRNAILQEIEQNKMDDIRQMLKSRQTLNG
jgi:hypothetical protein